MLLGEKDMRTVGETLTIGDYRVQNVRSDRNPKRSNQWMNVAEYRYCAIN